MTKLPEPRLIPLSPHQDDRGGLWRLMIRSELEDLTGTEFPVEQCLLSETSQRGTLRGLHAQLPPYSEAKVISAISGHMWWVSVDLRKGSDGFGTLHCFDLQAGSPAALYVPGGFGHGCVSLSDDIRLVICADKPYADAKGVGIHWQDPDLAVPWPISEGVKISDGHQAFGSFQDFINLHGGL